MKQGLEVLKKQNPKNKTKPTVREVSNLLLRLQPGAEVSCPPSGERGRSNARVQLLSFILIFVFIFKHAVLGSHTPQLSRTTS